MVEEAQLFPRNGNNSSHRMGKVFPAEWEQSGTQSPHNNGYRRIISVDAQ